MSSGIERCESALCFPTHSAMKSRNGWGTLICVALKTTWVGVRPEWLALAQTPREQQPET
jgi:hypothetical protein